MAKIIPNEEQVFMVSKGINTTFSGSAATKAMNEWYTMQDVIDTVKPYKVYTAILNQEGEGSLVYIEEGSLIVGVTYSIKRMSTLDKGDFTNVGAPDNNAGTSFVATGEIPNKWGISQLSYNVGAPIATVLENSIGNIWFEYGIVGKYKVSSTGLFTPIEKTTIFIGPSIQANIVNFTEGISENGILISSAENGDASNNQLINTAIEIRVYN